MFEKCYKISASGLFKHFVIWFWGISPYFNFEPREKLHIVTSKMQIAILEEYISRGLRILFDNTFYSLFSLEFCHLSQILTANDSSLSHNLHGGGLETCPSYAAGFPPIPFLLRCYNKLQYHSMLKMHWWVIHTRLKMLFHHF